MCKCSLVKILILYEEVLKGIGVLSIITSFYLYARSSGKIENSVKTCKLLINKALLSKADFHLVLFEFKKYTQGKRWCLSVSENILENNNKNCLPKDLVRHRVSDAEKVVSAWGRVSNLNEELIIMHKSSVLLPFTYCSKCGVL